MTNQMIAEGRFIMDLTDISSSDLYPCLAEKEAEINEAREREGLPRFEVDYDSLDPVGDTLYADCHLLCLDCGKKLNMGNGEEVASGRCSDCSLFPPLTLPAILRQLEAEMRQ